MLFNRDTDILKQFTRTRFGGVAIELRKLHLEIGNLHAFHVTHFRQRVQPVTFLHHFPKPVVAHHDRVEDPVLLIGKLVLRKLANTGIRVGRHIARRGFEVACEDLHQG